MNAVYKTTSTSITSKTGKTGAAGLAGNVLVGGLVGIGVDAMTGAHRELSPNPLHVELEKK